MGLTCLKSFALESHTSCWSATRNIESLRINAWERAPLDVSALERYDEKQWDTEHTHNLFQETHRLIFRQYDQKCSFLTPTRQPESSVWAPATFAFHSSHSQNVVRLVFNPFGSTGKTGTAKWITPTKAILNHWVNYGSPWSLNGAKWLPLPFV